MKIRREICVRVEVPRESFWFEPEKNKEEAISASSF
jgi:hypothetical protein